jgi:hypothetical protein
MYITSPVFEIFDDAVAFVRGNPEHDYHYPVQQPGVVSIQTEHAVMALVVSGGNIHRAAKALGVRRMRLQDWVDMRPEVQACLIDMREEKLDDIVDVQFALAIAGDSATGRFLLQTVGKERGYVARSETTGKDGVPLSAPTVNFSQMSTEALREMRDATTGNDNG